MGDQTTEVPSGLNSTRYVSSDHCRVHGLKIYRNRQQAFSPASSCSLSSGSMPS